MFFHKGNLNTHIGSIHVAKKSFVCGFCQKECSHKSALMPRPSARTNNFCLGQKQICSGQNNFCPAQNFCPRLKSYVRSFCKT